MVSPPQGKHTSGTIAADVVKGLDEGTYQDCLGLFLTFNLSMIAAQNDAVFKSDLSHDRFEQ